MSEILRVYDLVRVKEPQPVWRSHFETGEAIISGRGVGGFTLFFRERGEVSWYGPENLELVRRHQPDLLDLWEKERDEWRFAND